MAIKKITIAIIILLQCITLNAQLKLIPTPQITALETSTFTFDKSTTINESTLDAFYAEELINIVKEQLDIDLKQTEKHRKNSIEFIRISSIKKLSLLLDHLGLDTKYKLGKEGYILSVKKKRIRIIAQTDAGIFYGIQTLKQLITANRIENSIPCLVIYDAPDFAIRGWQDDISRGPIPTMELLKKQIRTMASHKLNHFTLYIEHVFKFEKHPGIAPEDGITKAQLDELTEYARQYHVSLIGSYQSFGHMAKTLSHPNYKHLAENEHIISPALEESYEFLKDVYSEIVPAFNGEYFNINCDETFGLGEGKSKSMVDTMGIDGVYLYHINKLNAMLEPFNKKILMWGDIVTSYPQIISKLPEDITVMAWGYHAAESFDYAVKPIAETGLNFWVAPGINCWANIFPNFHETEINIYNFIRDGYKHGATGVLNTSWDDDGLNFFHNNWHGLIWGAENSWKAPVTNLSPEGSILTRKSRYTDFNRNFDAIFYELEQDGLIQDIIAFSNLHQSGIKDILRNGRLFEPVFPIHLDYISDDQQKKNLELLAQLKTIREKIGKLHPEIMQNQHTLEYLNYAIHEVEFSVHKNLLRIDLYYYINDENTNTASILRSDIQQLIKQARFLKTEYKRLWNQENRLWWLDKNLAKFDHLIESLENLEGHCIISPDNTLTDGNRMISIRSLFNDLPVWYSMNTDTVTEQSVKYNNPFTIDTNANIQASVITSEKTFPYSVCKLIHHKAIGKLHKLNATYSDYHPSYDGGGQYALIDGKLGEYSNLKSGLWQGFSGQDIDIELDFGEVQAINFFSMGFYQNTHSWVIFPKKIEIYGKDEISEDYKLIQTIENTISPKEKGSSKQNYTTKFDSVETRFLKIIAYHFGKLPEWHHAGSQYDSMIFADEIIIK